jgi:MFS family permease
MSAAPQAATPTRAPEATHKAAWWALGVLTVTMLFAVLDRAVLQLQAETIKRELGLTDFQLGFLQGTAVALVVAAVSYPLGWVADRYDRRWVLVGCVLFWSLAVVGSGLSKNYVQILIGSALVGAGEAGLIPIANALIPQLFSQRHRQTANSVFAVSTTLVSALGLGITGAIIGGVHLARPYLPEVLGHLEDWRLSFLMVALPAPAIALLLLTIPRLSQLPLKQVSASNGSTVVDVLPYIRSQKRTYMLFYGALAVITLGVAGLGGWMAVIYQRVFAQTPQQLGAVLGGLGLGTTLLGFLISVYGLRYFAPRFGPAIGVRLLSITAFVIAGCYLAMTQATAAWHMYVIHGVYVTLVIGSTMVSPTIVQTIAPNRVRARVFALTTMLMAGCGSVSMPIVGLISDQWLSHMKNGIVVAGALYAVPFLILGGILMRACEKPYLATKADVEALDAAEAAAPAPAAAATGAT